jgi:hypothetical protein
MSETRGFEVSMEHITIYRVTAPDGTLIWECDKYIGYQLSYAISRVLSFHEDPNALKARSPEWAIEQWRSQALEAATILRQCEYFQSFPDRIKIALEAIG